MADHNDLGKQGEQLAVNYLLEHGYAILARNFVYQKAEVDIIAKKKAVLAVVEVKTRSSAHFGDPQEFLKPKQINRIVKAVDEYIKVENLDVEVRFDIMAIVINKNETTLEHLKNAFYHF